ncbi:LysR family transcriptional regulator [Vibrio mediterranei]|nr:LysR family transcriptional regulator [Vibrio mediterranei]
MNTLNTLNMQTIETFVEVVESKSFSAAARKLGRAQSYVSNLVFELEDWFGETVFDRQGRYPILTEKGHELYFEAKALHEARLLFTKKAKYISLGEHNSFSFASDMMSEFPEGEQILHKINTLYPNVELRLTNPSGDHILRLLYEGHLDAAVISGHVSFDHIPNIGVIPVSNTPVYCVATDNHPVMKSSKITVNELMKHRQVIACSHLRTNESRKPFLKISPSIWEADSVYDAATLVAHGFGWAILPEHIVDLFESNNLLKKVPLAEGVLPQSISSTLAWNKDKQNNPILKTIINTLNK